MTLVILEDKKMIEKKDLQRLQRMLKDFKYQVYDMDFMHRALWHDMENYIEALIEEETENAD